MVLGRKPLQVFRTESSLRKKLLKLPVMMAGYGSSGTGENCKALSFTVLSPNLSTAQTNFPSRSEIDKHLKITGRRLLLGAAPDCLSHGALGPGSQNEAWRSHLWMGRGGSELFCQPTVLNTLGEPANTKTCL